MTLHPGRAFPATLILFFFALSISAAHAEPDTECPAPPKAGDPVEIFPADQIRDIAPGTTAYVYTVFQGMKAECFEVRLDGVDPDGIGPGHDMIYFTPSAGHAAQTNIVHGMSGSPVYLDGKLLGALSYDISMDFTVAPTGGITPAAYMKEIIENRSREATTSAFLASEFKGYDPQKSAPDIRLAAGTGSGARVSTTVNTSGISSTLLAAFHDTFAHDGFELASGGASATDTNPDVESDPSALAPGEMIVIPLVSGDTSMGVSGTVTYNDGKQILAFGHPFNQSGPIRLPMMTGNVLKIVDSSHTSFKATVGVKTVGALVEDRATGVMGILGEQAPTTPMTMHLKTEVRDRDFHFAISRVPGMLPKLAALSIASVLEGVNEVGDRDTMKVSATLKIAGHGDYSFSQLYADESGNHEETIKGLAMWLMAHIDSVTSHPSEPAELESIGVTAEIIPESRLMKLEKIRALSTTAKAGDTVAVEATFYLPGYPTPLTHTFNVKLPSDLHPGALTLSFATAGDFNEKMVQALEEEKDEDSLDATLKILKTEHPNGALYAEFSQDDEGPADGKKKKHKKKDDDAFIVDMRAALENIKDEKAEKAKQDKAAASEVALPLAAVFTGDAQKTTITIQ